MSQLDLFDVRPTSVPLVRPSDPDTSHIAARPTRHRSEVRDQIAAILRAEWPHGLTDHELFARTGLPESQRGSMIRRRAETGATDSSVRRPSPSGYPCVVWVLPKEKQ